MPALTIKHETTTTTTMRFSDAEICEALRKAGHKIPLHDVRVLVRVPGGGDYSNTDLDVTAESPVTIIWETKSTSHGL